MTHITRPRRHTDHPVARLKSVRNPLPGSADDLKQVAQRRVSPKGQLIEVGGREPFFGLMSQDTHKFL